MTEKLYLMLSDNGDGSSSANWFHENDATLAQLRVLICPDSQGGFVAQGLEMDYCATGATEQQVQERFADGFLGTIESLLKRNRSLSALFKSRTPSEEWQRYIEGELHHELTCATVVDLTQKMPAEVPFKSLAFCRPRHESRHD